eukprot:Nk52_evm108s224 gene=Nk52_evmTU108s224
MFHFAIDRGGTFTDVYAECPNGKTRVLKLLSVDPANYSDAPREGIRRILESETGVPYPRNKPVDSSKIGSIRMGTTVATNSLLERNGERVALLITKGFSDLLHIGTQARPKIFDLKIEMPDVLYECAVEIDERVQLLSEDEFEKGKPPKDKDCHKGTTGEWLTVVQKPKPEEIKAQLQKVYDSGIRSLAVVFMHSYTFSDHERVVGDIAKAMGFTHISLSSEVMPMVKIVARGYTACADAYLTPCIKRYVESFSSGFDKNFEKSTRVLFMQSDGGLTPVSSFSGSRAILSGPAGGVVGYAFTAYENLGNMVFDGHHQHKKQKLDGAAMPSHRKPVIGFDMGGTSTDVSRYDGVYEHVFESTTAGVTIQAPQLDINTVAAGGGSRLFYRSGLFVVGPESSSAHPGPVCYRKGGYLSVTDANLMLCRIQPSHFPCIFGPNEDEPLDYDATKAAFETLTKEVNQHADHPMSPEEVAFGFIQVANEAMCRPIRALTQAKGYDTTHHALSCFGGAGGQHACAIAKSLGMSTIYIHKYSGILSAYGLSLADVVYEAQEPSAAILEKSSREHVLSRLDHLKKQCSDHLLKQGFERSDLVLEAYLNLRYEKTDCAIMTLNGEASDFDFESPFLEQYQREFGFTIPGRAIVIDDIRVRGVGKSRRTKEMSLDFDAAEPKPVETVSCYFEGGFVATNLFKVSDLKFGQKVNGPAILLEANSTILVEPNCTAYISDSGDIRIDIVSGKSPGHKENIEVDLDMIQLSIFSHRFMSIAEQMGRALQRTSISTNIKERLDFSCALFGPDGGLVANAPHIPVHLGAMQEAVRFQIDHLGKKIQKGDVLVSNHPSAGGSHLPDITVMTPVFHKNEPKPVFWVASRGHHADIGGITPGSMPPNSNALAQEGAAIVSFHLVRKGEFQEKGISDILSAPGQVKGSCGTRNLADNISDLKAQVAANHKGITLVNELIEQYDLATVQAYMRFIQENAEVAVRDMLSVFAKEAENLNGKPVLMAEDFMDDGTKIQLTVKIDKAKGSAVFDFSGTGCEVFGNCNAPRAVTYSAIIYCLRCMVGHDIPLNQGCLKPISTIIPENTILHPSEGAAVVGGNVLTSQRVVDVILKAFSACSASQGCMNNLTFGSEKLGYYETIAGGAGAGPTWNGRSGIHTHMTNTRITDPEILERRYPVVLNTFELRKHSGGLGKFDGGDGVVREILFKTPMTVSLLTERRAFQPYGLKGGHSGKCGMNLLVKSDGRIVNVGSKNTLHVEPGDIVRILTPGGGGYGDPSESESGSNLKTSKTAILRDYGSVNEYSRNQLSA